MTLPSSLQFNFYTQQEPLFLKKKAEKDCKQRTTRFLLAKLSLPAN